MRFFIQVAIVITGLLTAGCAIEPANEPQTKAISSPSPAPSASPVEVGSAAVRPITLPVLDAFFADESFAPTLKSRLQLSDDQIAKLKEIAHSETTSLDESQLDASGDSAGARTDAEEKIKAIVGDEKSKQLAALINELWTGNDTADKTTGSNATEINAVPTDSRVVVNAPAFRMDVFDDGRLVKSYKIGIGYPQFPLPTGLRKARAIIFNPTWTPPDEPWVAKMKNISVGKKVEAGSRLNPLGPIKIPIGGPSLIHGGKPIAKLGTFASHGCVGLTTAQMREFTKQLAELGGTTLSDPEIANFARAKTETKEVKLKQEVPVELRYETIVAEDGSLHIYRDVYDQGSNTEENLRAVLEANGISLEDLTSDERTKVMEALSQMSGKTSISSSTPSPGPSVTKDERNARAAVKRTTPARNRNEIVIEIAALKGKGYPAPVELDTGNGSR